MLKKSHKNSQKRAVVDAAPSKPAKTATRSTVRARPVDAVDAAAPRTEGQRLLLAVPGSLSTVARAIGCSKALAGYWRTGKKLPASVFRSKLAEVYGIGVESWGQTAAAETSVPSEYGKAPMFNASRSSARPTETASHVANPAAVADDVLARFDEMIADARSRRQSKTLLASEYARLIGTEARLLRERAIAEREINRDHPEWQRWYKAVLDALHAHPKALADVVAALKRVA